MKSRVFQLWNRSQLRGFRPRIHGLLPLVSGEGRLVIGPGCLFRSFRLRPSFHVDKGAVLEFGAGVFVNDGVNICATVGIRIGAGTKIGDMTYIYDSNFHETEPGSAVHQRPVFIGDNVWLAANCKILAGAIIGDHTIIEANSVVSGEIPARSVAGGVPARVIRQFEAPEGWVRS